jgi:single-strand DNA-binding protein
MNDALITLVGFVAAPPRYTITGNGTPFMSLRVGSTPRRFDRETGQWRDGETTFLTANCWRALADNLNSSDLKQGDAFAALGGHPCPGPGSGRQDGR